MPNNYVSEHSGSELEAVLDLFVGKGLDSVEGVVKRNASGNFVVAPSNSSETTISLTTGGWSNGTQTVSVSGVTTTNSIFITPAPATKDEYVRAGVYCSVQGNGTLTFICNEVPTSALSVNVMILNR